MKRLGLLQIILSAYAVVMGQGTNSRLRYDKEKDLNGISMEPILLSMHEDYDPMDYSTWPAYSTPCVAAVAPKDKNIVSRTALWCTKKATYMFSITEHWENRIFTSTSTKFIRDSKTGKKYYVKEHMGAPLDVSYWIKGHEGEYIYMVGIYPPLPKSCTHIDIGQDTEPAQVPGATSWVKNPVVKNIPVSELQANQYLITGKVKRTK